MPRALRAPHDRSRDIAAGADDQRSGRSSVSNAPHRTPHAPGDERPARVAPPLVAVDRLDRQQVVAERVARQDLGFDAPLRADQHRLDVGTRLAQRLGQRQRGHQVPAGAAAGDQDLHGVSSARRPRPLRRCSHADEHRPVAIERDEQTRAPVGDERQRDAGRGQHRQLHADVQHGAQMPISAVSPAASSWPNGSRAERAMRKPSQMKRPNPTASTQHADEAPLLADRGEDEIGVGVRQVAELLLALADPHAEQPPRADADERLVHLPGRLGGRAARIQEREHARQPVLRGGHRAEHERGGPDGEQQEVADLRARREQHDPGEQRDEQRHREIGLEEDEPDERCRRSRASGSTPRRKLRISVALLGREHRRPDHHGDLGELGGLDGEPEIPPSGARR